MSQRDIHLLIDNYNLLVLPARVRYGDQVVFQLGLRPLLLLD